MKRVQRVYIENNLRSERSGGEYLRARSELKVNEKTFAAVASLPRYFLAVAAFLWKKKTFLKILIFLFLEERTGGMCLPGTSYKATVFFLYFHVFF